MSADSDRRLILVCMAGVGLYLAFCLAAAVFGLPRGC